MRNFLMIIENSQPNFPPYKCQQGMIITIFLKCLLPIRNCRSNIICESHNNTGTDKFSLILAEDEADTTPVRT